jgi:YVTN family beta-propeller protein
VWVTVSPDGSQVWAGNGFSASVSIIATATNSIVATVDGPGPPRPRQLTARCLSCFLSDRRLGSDT